MVNDYSLIVTEKDSAYLCGPVNVVLLPLLLNNFASNSGYNKRNRLI